MTDAAGTDHRVVAAVLVRERRVLLCLRRSDRPWYPGVWDVPGGHVEAGETEIDALARELLEELGVTAGTARCRTDVAIPGGLLSVFLLDTWRGEPANTAPDEHETIEWYGADELPGLRLADPRLADLLTRWLEPSNERG